MIVVHRGAGGLAIGFGILTALAMNVLSYRFLGFNYYEEHEWPKLGVLIISGLACLVTGLLLKKKRKRDAEREKQYLDSLGPKYESAKAFAFAGPRDHLMFIPLQYWSIVYFVAAIVYAATA
jgi:hypothetical protein